MRCVVLLAGCAALCLGSCGDSDRPQPRAPAKAAHGEPSSKPEVSEQAQAEAAPPVASLDLSAFRQRALCMRKHTPRSRTDEISLADVEPLLPVPKGAKVVQAPRIDEDRVVAKLCLGAGSEADWQARLRRHYRRAGWQIVDATQLALARTRHGLLATQLPHELYASWGPAEEGPCADSGAKLLTLQVVARKHWQDVSGHPDARAEWWLADPDACAVPELSPGDKRRPSIILITADTLRADHLGSYGYFRDTTPNLDRLARDALLFENTVTPMATTLPAHVSLMSATNPMRHGVQKNGMRPAPGLFFFAEMLQQRGYMTAAFVSAMPVIRDTGMERGFELFVQPTDPNDEYLPEVRADVMTERAITWLRSKPRRPFFLWIHYWDVHDPYEPLPSERKRYRTTKELLAWLEERGIHDPKEQKGPFFRTRTRGATDTISAVELYNLYDAEVHYLDSQVAKLMAALEALGLYDESAIVFTADHGEGLLEHEWLHHGRIYNEELFVPLIFKLPAASHVEPRREQRFASLIDIVPTLVAVLELPVAPALRRQFEGINLLGNVRREYVFSQRVRLPAKILAKRGWEPGDKFAMTGAKWKFLHVPAVADQLFPMGDDRSETQDVIAEHPELAQKLRRMTEWKLRSYKSARRSPAPKVSDETAEALEGLGYR